MIKFAVENPVKVLVGVCFLVIFGIQAFINMPYRLIPSIEYPQISISMISFLIDKNKGFLS